MNLRRLWICGLALGALAAGWCVAAPASQFPPIYFAAEGAGKIIRYNEKGQPAWEFPAEMARDVQYLPSGNILFCYNNKYNPKRSDNPAGVMEVTPQKQVVFHFQTTGQVWTCQRLLDGRTLVGNASQGALLLVNAKGAVEKTIRINNAPGHSALRHARATPSGHFVVAEEAAKAVREYDTDGKLLREIKTPWPPFSVAVQPDGLIVISGQSGMMAVNLAGHVQWQMSAKDFPELGIRWLAGFQTLDMGRLLVCNAGGKVPLFAVAPSKGKKPRIIWPAMRRPKIFR